MLVREPFEELAIAKAGGVGFYGASGELFVEVRDVALAVDDWNEERLDFLLNELIPVDAVEPGMRLDVGNVLHPLIRHLCEQFVEQVFQVVAPLLVQVWLLMLDLIEEVASVLCVKRRKSVH